MKGEKVIPSNYGSIPHLSTSKLTQQADKKIQEGQERILTKKSRDWKDLIIVTEKLDGSNVGVIKKNGELIAITRSGYTSSSSPYDQHKLFAEYVNYQKDKFSWLPEGCRIAGEWMIKTHGTKYNLTGCDPFVAFDLFDPAGNRLPYIDFIKNCYARNIMTVPLLHIGQPVSIKNCIKLLGDGHYGEPDKPEGFVYRLERDGKVEFLAKWVRADKEDGKYMQQDVYNIGANGCFSIKTFNLSEIEAYR